MKETKSFKWLKARHNLNKTSIQKQEYYNNDTLSVLLKKKIHLSSTNKTKKRNTSSLKLNEERECVCDTRRSSSRGGRGRRIEFLKYGSLFLLQQGNGTCLRSFGNDYKLNQTNKQTMRENKLEQNQTNRIRLKCTSK